MRAIKLPDHDALAEERGRALLDILERHGMSLAAYLEREYGRQDSQDALGEIMAMVLEHPPNHLLRPGNEYADAADHDPAITGAWVRTMARNKATDDYRATVRHGKALELEARKPDSWLNGGGYRDNWSAERIYLRHLDEIEALERIDNLPEPLMRKVVRYRYLGYSHQEIAQALRITVKRSQHTVARVRSPKIRGLLRHMGERP
jgi:DNA-directed RNA polymerase specialized sigma24 family protein